MATLKVEKSGPELFSFELQWKVNGKKRKQKLKFDTKGETANRELKKGTYALGWVATGDPGDSFSYTVTLDDEELEANEGTFTNDERAHGGAILVEVVS